MFSQSFIGIKTTIKDSQNLKIFSGVVMYMRHFQVCLLLEIMTI